MTRILLTLSLICLIMTGCSNSNEPIEFEDETQTIDLAEYEEVVYKNRELLSDWAYAMQDAQEEGTRAASMEEAECFEALKQNLLPSPGEPLPAKREARLPPQSCFSWMIAPSQR